MSDDLKAEIEKLKAQLAEEKQSTKRGRSKAIKIIDTTSAPPESSGPLERAKQADDVVKPKRAPRKPKIIDSSDSDTPTTMPKKQIKQKTDEKSEKPKRGRKPKVSESTETSAPTQPTKTKRMPIIPHSQNTVQYDMIICPCPRCKDPHHS